MPISWYYHEASNKRNRQATLAIHKTIVEGKSWKQGQELVFKFGPKGEVILGEQKSITWIDEENRE